MYQVDEKTGCVKRQATKDGNETIITATEADFEMAATIYNQHGDVQATKLTDVEKKVVRFLGSRARKNQERYGSALFNEIQHYLGVSKGRAYSILHGRDGKSGMLSKVPGLYFEKESETEYDKVLSKEITGEGIIYQQIGYLMRSGNPDSLDLMVAINYAVMAADLVVNGETGRLVALRNGNYVNVPISVVRQGVKRVDVGALYDVEQYRPKILHVDGKPMFLY
jgi:6-phosphofructokinase